MLDRRWEVSLLLKPDAGPMMQDRNISWLLRRKRMEEELSEEVIIAIPALFPVKREKEEVGLLQQFAYLALIGAIRDSRAKRSIEALQNRGLQEQRLKLRGLLMKYLGGQIVENI